MKLLAIETTGKLPSVAYYEDGKGIVEKKGPIGENHLISLLPMVKEILSEADRDLSNLDGIGVSTGPGSYTGIRIGVSTARALSQVSKVPLIEIPTLYTFNFNEEIEENMAVCPILDARRDQIYGACFLKNEEVIKQGAYTISEFLKELKEKDFLKNIKFTGDGIFRFQEIIKEELKGSSLNFSFSLGDKVYQSAESGIKVTREKFLKGQLVDFEKSGAKIL